jgi:two-component system, NarL family, sensor histidine kinase BarA
MSLLSPQGGIGQRTALIFAIPLLLTTLALGYHLTGAHMDDTRTALLERGGLIARHLAALCEFGMYSEDITELRKHAVSILREDNVIGVEISNSHGDTLVRMGDPAEKEENPDALVFNAPILRSGVPVSDFDSDTGATADNTVSTGAVQVTLSTVAMQQLRKSILLTGISLTGSGLLVSLLLAYIVSRSVAAPIVRLTGVVGELTGGNLTARASTDSAGELGSLELGINQMASSLEDAQHRLRRKISASTAELQHTVSMLEARNTELEQTRAEAVAAGAAKSEFLARMSHEIRTPLSAVIGFSGLLQETGLDDNQQEHVRTITQAAAQLLQVIDDILGYSRLDSGTMIIESVPFDLHEMLENVVSMLSAQAHEKDLELILYIHSDVPHSIISDPNRISQLLTNLVNNAIKFTEHGHVLVEVSQLDGAADRAAINFSVTDTGIGMSESQQDVIFNPFIQADVSTSRLYGGTGLGLSICRKLVALLGGEITVQSKPGKGSTFSVTATFEVDRSVQNGQACSLDGYKVVVYDRNPFTLRALRNRLFNWGATVFNTTDRSRLISMLEDTACQGSPCDLLVMGLAHDEFDTIPQDDWLLDVRQHCNAPVVVLIGADRMAPSGCSGDSRVCILPKPPRSERLLRSIRMLLALQQPLLPAQETTAASKLADRELAGLHLLIAEDNPFNQQLFLEQLTSHGIDVTLASTGAEASQLADQADFNLIFMDIHMPVMGGVDALQHIRRGRNRLTPIIALTADVFVDAGDGKQTTGMDDILYKPVPVGKLLEMVCKWCLPGRTGTPAPGDATGPGLPAGFRQRLQIELDSRLSALREAANRPDQEQLASHLHQLKGVIGYFGLVELDNACQALELAIQTGSQDEIHGALDRLEAIRKTQHQE